MALVLICNTSIHDTIDDTTMLLYDGGWSHELVSGAMMRFNWFCDESLAICDILHLCE